MLYRNLLGTLLLKRSVIEERLMHDGMMVVKLYSALDAQMT